MPRFLRHNTWHECIMQYLFLLFQRLFLSDFMSHAAASGADAHRNRGDTERDTGETRWTDEIAKEKIGRRSNKKAAEVILILAEKTGNTYSFSLSVHDAQTPTRKSQSLLRSI